jgi:hypothetical protein
MDDYRDMDRESESLLDSEVSGLRIELAEANRTIEKLKCLVVWGNRIEREARELHRCNGNTNALHLACQGYKEEREIIERSSDPL